MVSLGVLRVDRVIKVVFGQEPGHTRERLWARRGLWDEQILCPVTGALLWDLPVLFSTQSAASGVELARSGLARGALAGWLLKLLVVLTSARRGHALRLPAAPGHRPSFSVSGERQVVGCRGHM